MLVLVQPDFKISAKHMQKFFPLVRVGLAASTPGLHAEEVRFHRGATPGEQFHANVRGGFQNFSFGRTDKALMFTRGLEEGKDVRAIELRDAAQRGDRRTHLAAFECTEKPDGNAGGPGYLRERKAALCPHAPKTLPWSKRAFRARRHDTLML